MIAWPLLKTFLQVNWKPIAAAVIVGALYAWHVHKVNNAWHAGRAALEQEQAAEAKRRAGNAQAAEDAFRKCASDPACRVRDDGHRRD